eukprot:GHVU01133495.1.p1 GENE.GHVU01133495.1~~GHVU01133495.1.p1  ORF type:complete len:338 (+),score=39.10 GHVU01133495.1:5043-6056(+)
MNRRRSSSVSHSSVASVAASETSSTLEVSSINRISGIVAENGEVWVEVVDNEGVTRRVRENTLVDCPELCRAHARSEGTTWSERLTAVRAIAAAQQVAIGASTEGRGAAAAEDVPKKRKHTSAIWTAFRLIATVITNTVGGVTTEKQVSKTICTVKGDNGQECGARQQWCNNTSNLWKHLQRHHKVLFDSLDSRRGLNIPPMPDAVKAKTNMHLALWVVKHCRPINCLKDEELNNAFQEVSYGAYSVPSPYVVTNLLRKMAEDIQRSIILLINMTKLMGARIPVALDIWTKGGVSLLALTCYVIVVEGVAYKCKEVLLAAIPFGEVNNSLCMGGRKE